MKSFKFVALAAGAVMLLSGCSSVSIKDGGVVSDFTVEVVSASDVPDGMLDSMEPSIVIKDATHLNVVLYGSGSCEPFIDKVVDNGTQVALIVKNYGDLPCTMDYRSLPMSVTFNGNDGFDFREKTFTACSQGSCVPVNVLGTKVS